MAEEPVVPAEATPSQEPSSLDVDKLRADIRAEVEASFEERLKGFQTALNRKDEEIRGLSLASMTDEERENITDQETREYIERLEKEVELAKLANQYPQVYPVYKQLLEAETPEQQAQILASLASPPPAPEPEVEVPAVDLNNPAPAPITGSSQRTEAAVDGTAAWDYLKRLGDRPMSELTNR